MKKILVPVDFSEHSKYALDFAIQFNQIIKGKITLMHVLELPTGGINYGADVTASTAEVAYRRELIDGISTRMHELEKKVEKEGQKAAIRVEFGTPYKNIGKEIAEEGADWVIVGSKGSSGLTEIMLGSNAEKIIRHSNCPVITVKGKVDLSSWKSMVFASTLSNDQESVAAKARGFQQMMGLNMHVLRVKTPFNMVTIQTAKEQIDEFAERNAFLDYSSNVVEADYADQGIVRFAEDVNAGIIVMGTHGRTGLAHIFGGSNSEDVANHSKIPVLTFRIEE